MLIGCINYLYFSIGAIPIWPTKDEIHQSMPNSFKNTFPNTRCILDCAELFRQSPSSLKAQSSLYYFINTTSYKRLVFISPSGAIIIKVSFMAVPYLTRTL